MQIDWSCVMRDQYPTACRIIGRLMPPGLRSGYAPEDFVGDAMIELMANPAAFVERGTPMLVMIAKRRMIDAARSPRSRLLPLEVDIVDHRPSPELEFDAAELRERMLRRAVDPRKRTAVLLRCDGYTLPEIAASTGFGLRSLQRYWKDFVHAIERN
jgi:DNA-directed RNA polymerase specialized sigma24 family protein